MLPTKGVERIDKIERIDRIDFVELFESFDSFGLPAKYAPRSKPFRLSHYNVFIARVFTCIIVGSHR